MHVTRRSFLATSATAGVALAAPAVHGAEKNKKYKTALVGTGWWGMNVLRTAIEAGQSNVVAMCDVDRRQLDPATAEVQKLTGKAPKKYKDFRDLLDGDKPEIVIVGTPDHWHPLVAVAACRAGAHVYVEKPVGHTIKEGRAMVAAARAADRVVQVGTHRRVSPHNMWGIDFLRQGKLGKVGMIRAFVHSGGGPGQPVPDEEPPEGLDWDMWCGQTELRPYNAELHRAWMAWRAYSGGEVTNWGAHGLDQVQWALGMSHTGPTEVWLDGRGLVRMRYDNGALVRMELDRGPMGGAIFVGSKGKIEINRNKFTTNPPELIKNPPSPATAKTWEGPGWVARPHLQNWLDCIKTRGLPNADVEIGFRSVTVCHLAGIVRAVGRKLNWDPAAEQFRNDDEANTYVNRPRREAYALPKQV